MGLGAPFPKTAAYLAEQKLDLIQFPFGFVTQDVRRSDENHAAPLQLIHIRHKTSLLRPQSPWDAEVQLVRRVRGHTIAYLEPL